MLPIDKPSGLTSFDVIRRLRRVLHVRKIGHTGTLDPLATGLLICCIGRATKQARVFQEMDKEYTGALRLGQETPSYDADTPVSRERPWEHVSLEQIREAMEKLVGEIIQLAPVYSAVKVHGERLYKKARAGERALRPPRIVSVYAFEPTGLDGPVVSFRVFCSKGTYVRTLVHDVGSSLSCGAHVVSLRRTRIGPIGVDVAWDLPLLCEQLAPGRGRS